MMSDTAGQIKKPVGRQAVNTYDIWRKGWELPLVKPFVELLRLKEAKKKQTHCKID